MSNVFTTLLDHLGKKRKQQTDSVEAARREYYEIVRRHDNPQRGDAPRLDELMSALNLSTDDVERDINQRIQIVALTATADQYKSADAACSKAHDDIEALEQEIKAIQQKLGQASDIMYHHTTVQRDARDAQNDLAILRKDKMDLFDPVESNK